MRRGLAALFVVVILLGAAAAAALLWVNRYMNSPLPLAQPIVTTITPGTSLHTIAQNLKERGVLTHPRIWAWYARSRDLATRIHAGEYQFVEGTTPAGILDQMVRGEVILRALTVVEGTSFRDLLNTLAAHASVKHTIAELSEEELMGRLGAPGMHPEGQFFPDTYRFAAGTTDLEILKRAYTQMQQRLAAAWESRATDLPLQTPYQALILASIVEKETGLAAERPRVAGVFTRRLRVGMRLQSDPTVIYGLGAAYDGDIRRRDLRGDTPYNTYTRDGLPPTPIALPGEAALRAVVQPEDTGAIFFVATGASDGSHYFSATLEEHSAAIRRYLARSRSQRSQSR